MGGGGGGPGPGGGGDGITSVSNRNAFDWAAFKAHLESELGAGARLLLFRALGKYDNSTNRLTAARAVATLR